MYIVALVVTGGVIFSLLGPRYVHPRLRMAPFKDSGVGGFLEPTTTCNGDGSGAPGELLIRVPAACIMYADAESTRGFGSGAGPELGDLKQVTT